MEWVKQNQLTLRQAVAEIVLATPEGLSEYELIKQLQQAPYLLFEAEQLKQELALFQCHFFLFNTLYQLQLEWLSQKRGQLVIEALNIQLLPYDSGQAGVAQVDSLREYYLDWRNYEETGEAEVEQLLTDFWRKMAGERLGQPVTEQELVRACELLQLASSPMPELQQLKRQYRRLQHQHHPDKGGDGEYSKQLEWAYRLLIQTLN